jgi:hypothetical protein
MEAEAPMGDEKLRDELLAWQEGQRELHRWKLVAVGGLAALGLGLTEQGKPQLLVLCLAPFVVAYCDALLRDYDLRVGLIGFFLLKKDGLTSDYELFLEEDQVKSSLWWHLGKSASISSSLATCALTALIGFYRLWVGCLTPQAYSECWATLGSAFLGALLVCWIQRAFRKRYDRLREAANIANKINPRPNGTNEGV